jgi:hypothetical protein
MIQRLASCTSTQDSCITPCCSHCSPHTATTTSSVAAAVDGVKFTLSLLLVFPAIQRLSHFCSFKFCLIKCAYV